MDELIRFRVTDGNEVPVTTSLKVAEVFGKDHAHVLRDIQNLECSDEFRLSNFGLSNYINEQRHRMPMYFITRDGFTFLAMGYRGKKAAKFKEQYIGAFNTMEKLLNEKHTTAWLETRRKGILTRRSETDVIKDLVEYAKGQGSEHAEMLYVTYTKLANSMSGVSNREQADTSKLNDLGIFENLIRQMILNGMAAGLGYKEIYKVCKERCQSAKEIAMIG